MRFIITATFIVAASSLFAGTSSISDLSQDFVRGNWGKRITAAGIFYEASPFPYIQTNLLKIFIVPDPGGAAVNYQAKDKSPWIVSGVLHNAKEAKNKYLKDGYCFFWSELRYFHLSRPNKAQQRTPSRHAPLFTTAFPFCPHSL
jgi:hypothetical protein